jgi:hypothetical protein
MKRTLLALTIMCSGLLLTTQLLTSCESKKESSETGHDHTKMDSTTVSYACPMHPEVTGKEGDTCSKCGMKLVAVKSADTTKHEH